MLPATIALAALFLWSLLTVIAGVGSDFSLGDWLPSSDLTNLGDSGLSNSPHNPLENALAGVLMTPMKWLNLREIPFIIWGSIFTISWWLTSITAYYAILRQLLSTPINFWASIPVTLICMTIAAIVTKYLTHPLRHLFASTELKARDLVGEEVTVSSYEASIKHGQARFKTNGAPLLLNIRTDGPTLPQGTRVWITHYDSQKRVYQVSATTTSAPKVL